MSSVTLKPGMIIRGPVLPEPVEVLAVVALGAAVRVIGKGLSSGLVRDAVLTPEHLAQLDIPPSRQSFDGDPKLFRLGVEAQRLGLAYEYDPFFSLSIARVDPLPHQLEAVYDYFLKLPRIRFLLADDPGAGKTIMAGLLLKEMKARGLVKRVLIVAPANLTFQWQRELKDKFRENFEVIRSDVLRANYGQNPWQDRSQVITSISWVSRVEDARESLLRSHWDLIIVDEAHKMAAYADDRKTLAYKLGESLSSMTDHYLLMTATPHKGDPENFCLFLSLLDRDVYGSVESLAAEGVVGADAIFACIGPALEVFSRYSRVERANGETVALPEYLEHVWATVSKEALSVIFKDADTAGLEPDARLTAIWLWTIGAGRAGSNGPATTNADSTEELDAEEEDESETKKPRLAGFAMEYDAARKIAQGLGVHLEKLDSLVEIKGETARLLPVVERTRYLFGKEAQAEHENKARGRKKVKQATLFEELAAVEATLSGAGIGLGEASPGTRPGLTVLDRIHQAMILFAAGRGEAMKRFLVDDGAGTDPRFWKLAQSLSALYPAGTDEKRWVDGVLARKKGLGFQA